MTQHPIPPACRPAQPQLHHAALRLAWLAIALALTPPASRADGAPRHDHVVVVVMENKGYDQVRTQPYTASLIASGAAMSASFGVTHPSQPNYLALWAGSTLGVTTNGCPAPGSPFTAENLGHACEAAGRTWRAYSEDLPVEGSTSCSSNGDPGSGPYTRKHAPWTQFGNLNHVNERPYSDLALDLATGTLPNLAFVVPNNCHNTHNSGTSGCAIPDGDAWLAANLPPILSALGSNGLLILTWDEDDYSADNHVLTVFVGAHVLPGVVSATPITHYSLVRTLCATLGLASFGQAAGEAAIADIWTQPVPLHVPTWGRLKTSYR